MKFLLSAGNYYGCCRNSRAAGPLTLSESFYAPGVEIPRHAHKNPYFIFTLAGSQEEFFGSRSRAYVPGTLAFHPAGETHWERPGPSGMRALHVEFGSAWMERHPEISRFLEKGTDFQCGRFGWLAQRIYREFCCFDDVASAAIEGLVLEMLAHASRFRSDQSDTGKQKWLIEAEELIRARFSEPLSLSDIANAIEVHPVSLARTFRRRHQSTVGEFIRRLRIEAACKAILAGDQKLSAIAVMVGFADQAHFSRTFKRIVGTTPNRFRITQSTR